MNKAFDWLSRVLTVICLVLLVLYAILVAVQVISRYAFNSPTTWTELVARYLFIWSIMLYMPVLYRNHGDSAFDMILNKQKPSVKQILVLLKDVLVLFSAIFLIVWGIKYCMLSKNKLMVGLVGGITVHMNWAYASLPVGGFFLFFVAVEQLALDCRKLGKEAA
jgi:TRAP-type C4-dicarboxylate transport system permease small subunit